MHMSLRVPSTKWDATSAPAFRLVSSLVPAQTASSSSASIRSVVRLGRSCRWRAPAYIHARQTEIARIVTSFAICRGGVWSFLARCQSILLAAWSARQARIARTASAAQTRYRQRMPGTAVRRTVWRSPAGGRRRRPTVRCNALFGSARRKRCLLNSLISVLQSPASHSLLADGAILDAGIGVLQKVSR
jgi:hypothetical protein